MPNIFTSNWAPQAMPATNMAVVNNFNNFQISQMQPQQYPPVPQQGYPMQQMQPIQGQGQTPGYPGQQGYPQQGYPQQGYPVSENSGMQMY